MLVRNFLSLKSTTFFNQIARKSQEMAFTSASTGSSGFHNTHSNNYEKMASNCTLSVAKIALSDPITPSSYILNNACGTGIVTSLIKSQHLNVRILGADLAPGMIETYKEKICKAGMGECGK
jgi:ubiquinone/menaquinone biosynthesis C-methylase UbiE